MQPSLFSPTGPSPVLPGYPCAWGMEPPTDDQPFGSAPYRYTLWRVWGGTERPRYLQVIGLNPSTAHETEDDPTIRRCVDFARRWDYDALCMTNLFAFRATDPAVMKAHPHPEGPENTDWILRIAEDASRVLAAWGVHGDHLRRAAFVREKLYDSRVTLHALGFTKDGHPRHPLYVPAITEPVAYPLEVVR